MNSTLVGKEILLHDSVNMGIAVALPAEMIVPVLRDADKMGLRQIAGGARELARRTRGEILHGGGSRQRIFKSAKSKHV